MEPGDGQDNIELASGSVNYKKKELVIKNILPEIEKQYNEFTASDGRKFEGKLYYRTLSDLLDIRSEETFDDWEIAGGFHGSLVAVFNVPPLESYSGDDYDSSKKFYDDFEYLNRK